MVSTFGTLSPRRLLVPLTLLFVSGCKHCDDDPCDKNPTGPTCPIPQGTIAVTVSGLPTGAPAAVTVEGGTVSVTVTTSRAVTVPPGTYTLRAGPVGFGGRVYFVLDSVRSVTVSDGQTISAPVIYGPIQPVLLASAAGLPAGSVAPWALGGVAQGDFGAAIGNSASVSLQPGQDYVIRAGGILSNGQLYGPTPASIAFRAEAGVQANFQVTWAPAATVDVFTPSLNGVGGSALAGLAGATASSRFFRVVVGGGATRLHITTGGGTGDADLYCRFGAPPVFPPSGTSGFGEGPTNAEDCSFDNPPAGTWYAMVVGGSAPFQGVTLGADLTLPASNLTIGAGAGSTGSGTVTVQAQGGGAAQVCAITSGTVVSGCIQAWPASTPVILTAAPTGGSGFTGWSGSCVGSQTTCGLTTGAAGTNISVTAAFRAPVLAVNPSTLSFTATQGGSNPPSQSAAVSNTGGGTIDGLSPSVAYANGQPIGWLAGTALSLNQTGTPATLTVAPVISGLASGSYQATITVNSSAGSKTVGVTLTVGNNLILSILGGGPGTGSGTVTGPAAGGQPAMACTITNGAAVQPGCTPSYPPGTVVSLTAAAAGGGTFVSWSGGGCSGATNPCPITLNAATTVTAAFALPTGLLQVIGGGSGSGTVTAPAAGGQAALNCVITGGAAVSGCSRSYPVGTDVTLIAAATGGGSFTGWSGAGCSGTGTCAIAMTLGGATPTASFAPPPAPVIGIETSQFAVNQGFRYPGTDTYVLDAVNLSGGGALTLNAPTVTPLDGSSGWLTASVSGSQLTLNVALKNGVGVTLNPSTARITVGAVGAAQPKTIDVKLYRANSAQGLVAGSRVYFHGNPGQATGGLSTLVPVPGNAAGQAATGVTIAGVWDANNLPVTPDWALSPLVDGQNRIVLQTKDAPDPFSPTPGTYYVLVKTSKTACNSRNPACTIEVKYSYNPEPRLRFDRFGLVFATGGASSQSLTMDAYNFFGSVSPDSLIINSVAVDPANGCNTFVTPTLPPAGPQRVIKSVSGTLTKVAIPFAANVGALTPNTAFDCTAIVDWSMWKDVGFGPESLAVIKQDPVVISVMRLPLETILARNGDLTTSRRISTGAQTPVTITLQNLGGIQVTSLAVVSQGPTCAGGAIVPSLGGSTTIGPEGTTTLSVTLNPLGLAPGLCTTTLKVTGQAPAGTLTTNIPVNFTVLP